MSRPLQLVLAAALMLTAVLVWSHRREVARNDPRLHTGDDGIVLLSTAWCGYCKRVKAAFDAAGVGYEELDIETSDAGERAYDALRGRGVPITVVGQDVVYGYNADKLSGLLGERGYRVDFK